MNGMNEKGRKFVNYIRIITLTSLIPFTLKLSDFPFDGLF